MCHIINLVNNSKALRVRIERIKRMKKSNENHERRNPTYIDIFDSGGKEIYLTDTENRLYRLCNIVQNRWNSSSNINSKKRREE